MSSIIPYEKDDLSMAARLKEQQHVKLFIHSLDPGRVVARRTSNGVEFGEQVTINGVPFFLTKGENTVPQDVATFYSERDTSPRFLSNTSATYFNSSGEIKVISLS